MESTTVICPKCGERNADTFRFCGMCGTALEPGKAAAQPDQARMKDVPVSLRIPANPPRAGATNPRPTPAVNSSASTQISGPSLLGLGSLPQSGPSLDTVREKAFSGTTPTFVYEDAQPRHGRTVLLALILAVLAVGIFIRYRYLGTASEDRKQQVAGTPAAPNSSPTSAGQPADNAANPPPAQNTPPSASAPAAKTDDGPTGADTTAKEKTQPQQDQPQQDQTEQTQPPQSQALQAQPSPKVEKPKTPPKQIAKADVPSRATKAAAKPAAPADTGSSTFLKGEAYLYGRGVAENCDEAIKNLKSASASGNAKARSTFGTMYATGHCVPRDLPTSYSWFAKALEADPNNQILTKDLNAIWNQMTPPEKQLATKIKQ